MDEAKTFKIQTAHLRRCIASLRLFDLDELQRAAEAQGSQADRDMIAALILALETLPEDPPE
jgi:hypothetical protein